MTPRFYKQFLLARNPSRYCNEVRAKFGDFVLVRGFLDFYMINDPELVGLVLVNKEGFVDRVNPKNEIYKRIANIGRTGLATSGAQHWKGQRKRIAPLVRRVGDPRLRRDDARHRRALERALGSA